jgi:hypothetical protein
MEVGLLDRTAVGRTFRRFSRQELSAIVDTPG